MDLGSSGKATLSTDLHITIASYLDVPAMVGLFMCSRGWGRLLETHDEVLWRPHCDRRPILAPMQLEDLVSTTCKDESQAALCTARVASASDFKAMVQLSSWADVFRSLWLLQGARLGLHRRATNNYNNDFRGQLVSLRCLKGCVVLENVAADGSVTVTHAVHFRRRPTGGGPLLMSVEEVSGRRGGSRWEYSRGPTTLDMWAHVVGTCQAFRLQRQQEARSFLPLRRSLPSDWAAVEANLLPHQRDILAELSGLWMGSYGPHGAEILSVELACKSWRENIQSGLTDERAAHVIGLKVIGDANVPAGQWSFMADLSSPWDIDERLNADRRPVFSLAGHIGTQRDLKAERADIKLWFRAMGQINAMPVGCDLIVYKRPDSDRHTFSVLWDDLGFHVRHAIDFQPLQIAPDGIPTCLPQDSRDMRFDWHREQGH